MPGAQLGHIDKETACDTSTGKTITPNMDALASSGIRCLLHELFNHREITSHGLSIEVDREHQSQVMYVYGCEFAEDAKGDLPSSNSDDKTDGNDINSEMHV